MACDSAKAVYMARILAIAHIVVGLLLVIFGIAERVKEITWTGDVCFGIWIGVWMCVTGGLGIPGTRKERSTPRNACAGVFLGFLIPSAVLGGIIIIIYSLTIVHKKLAIAFTWIIFILGIVEFAIGIWAAVCICQIQPCSNIAPPQQDQVTTDSAGYVMTQGPGGAPMAIPIQTSGGVVAVQTLIPVVQVSQPQIIMVPVSAVEGYQPNMVQAAASEAMTIEYETLQVDMPPPYEEVEHMT
ncbi:hypothetical protein ACROYT_G029895 [Oculina patagonica]